MFEVSRSTIFAANDPRRGTEKDRKRDRYAQRFHFSDTNVSSRGGISLSLANYSTVSLNFTFILETFNSPEFAFLGDNKK